MLSPRVEEMVWSTPQLDQEDRKVGRKSVSQSVGSVLKDQNSPYLLKKEKKKLSKWLYIKCMVF